MKTILRVTRAKVDCPLCVIISLLICRALNSSEIVSVFTSNAVSSLYVVR